MAKSWKAKVKSRLSHYNIQSFDKFKVFCNINIKSYYQIIINVVKPANMQTIMRRIMQDLIQVILALFT